MSGSVIRFGNKTSHGGTVLEASAMTDSGGKGMARVGDKVSCPIKNDGTWPIVSGDPTMIVDGKAVAREKCACMAIVLACASYIGKASVLDPYPRSAVLVGPASAPASTA